MNEKEKHKLENLLDFGVMFKKIDANTKTEVLSALTEHPYDEFERSSILRPKQIALTLNCSIDNVRKMLAKGKLLRISISPHVIGTTREALRQYLEELKGNRNA